MVSTGGGGTAIGSSAGADARRDVLLRVQNAYEVLLRKLVSHAKVRSETFFFVLPFLGPALDFSPRWALRIRKVPCNVL